MKNNINNKNYHKIRGKKRPKREKITDDIKDTVHHCLNRWSWGSNHPNNKVWLTDFEHKMLHIIFGNLHPHQILELVLKMVWKPMKEHIKKQILDILNEPDKTKLYKRNTIKNSKKFNRQNNR